MSKISPNNEETILATIHNFRDGNDSIKYRPSLISILGGNESIYSRTVTTLKQKGLVERKSVNKNIIITITKKGIEEARKIFIRYGDVFNQNSEKDLQQLFSVETSTCNTSIEPMELPPQIDKDKKIDDINNILDGSLYSIIKSQLEFKFSAEIPEKILRDFVGDVVEEITNTLYSTLDKISLYPTQEIEIIKTKINQKISA